MKTKINHLCFIVFFVLLTFSACQDETAEVNNPDEQETIQPDSQLATLMSRTTAHFGAMDDILDDASCFSIELPVTIIVSGITITLENEADLEQLEDLFDDFDDDEDFLDFIFPITLIFSDYTEIIIENEDQLEDLIDACEDDEDEIIECVDFIYPISFSVFDAGFDLLETVTIESDEALYEFLEDLEDDENALIVSLNYPVTLIYANGETIEVNSNEELVNAIESAEEDCDDEYECDEEDLDELLEECEWEVFLYTNDDTENLDGPYIFNFEDDGILTIEGITDELHATTWELNETDNGLELNIASFYYYEEQFGSWLVVECDDDDLELEHLTVDGTGLYFEQDCEDDLECSISDIYEIIGECAWELETNLIDSVVPIYVYFTPNGQVLVDNNNGNETQIGVWELIVNGGDIFMDFTLQQGFVDLSGQWQIVECEDDELYLVNENNYIELEQECIVEPNCSQEEVSNYLLSCNIVPTVDGYTSPLTLFQFSEDNTVFTMYQADLPHSGTWDISSDEDGIFIVINFTPFIDQYYNGQWYLSECSEDGLIFYQEDRELVLVCDVPEDNPFECFGNYDLTACDQENGGIDGNAEFDLNLIFANCPNDDVEYAFYLALSDAENQTSQLPSLFTNYSQPQTIYSRVSLAGDSSIFEIFTHNLIVEDCTNYCTEEDVDGILTECIWNITSFNGSDNLAEWNLDFESNSDIVVIYTDTETIDASWTTFTTSEGVAIEFSNVSGPNIQAITGSWLVVECTGSQLVLHDINDSDNEMVLDRSCN